MMNWKNILTLTLFLFGIQAFGQEISLFPDHSCGAPAPTKEQIKHTLDVIDNITLNRDGNMTHVPIRVHVVANNDGSNAVDLGEVNSAIANLNQKFSPIDVGFYIADINTILNSNYSDLDVLTEEHDLALPHAVPDAINMFFTHRLTTDIYDICGYAFYPVDNERSLRIFVRNECTNDIGSGTIPHEIGHFLNLYHTFNGTSKGNTHPNAENVARVGSQSNCDSHGDYLCDTEADPRGNINNECDYLGSAVDQYGAAYTPPIGNMMSYYNKMCGGDFTPGQYTRMAQALQDRLTHTSYTLSNPIYSNVANPTNVEATIGDNYSIDISWNDVSDNETGFIVERSEDDGATFTPLNNGGVAPNVSLFCDTSVESNGVYTYRVKPSNGNPEVYAESNILQANLTYCIPEYQPTSCDILEVGVGIQRVQIGANNELDHSSSCGGHTVVPPAGTPVSFNTSTEHPFSIELLQSDGQYVEQNVSIWADLNRDGNFNNEEELLYQSNFLTFGSQVINGTLIFPDCTTSGDVTLRVRSKYMPYGIVESPCDFHHFGESEDYTLYINEIEAQFAQISILEYSGEQDHDGLLCDGASATLIASGGVTYLWEDGSTSATRTVAETNIYKVTVFDGQGCSDSEVIAIDSNLSPTPTITVDGGSGQTTFCSAEDIELVAGGGESYLWEDGSTTATRFVNASGSYSVTVSNQGGCTATKSVVISIINEVNPSILILENSGANANDGLLCDGESATLIASGGNQYSWEDGTATAQRSVSNSGTYTVTVTNNDGCTGVESVQVQSESVMQTNISISENSGMEANDGTLCYGDQATLSATGGSIYLWENGSSNPQRVVSQPGNYSVTISNSNGCSQVQQQTVSVENAVIANIQVFETSGETNNDGFLCSGGEATLIATGGLSYLWDDNSSTNTRVVSESGIYTVEAFNAQGCSKLVSTQIVVVEENSASISIQETSGSTNNDGVICSGDEAILTATGGDYYSWNDGSTSNQLTVSESGIYQVNVLDQGGCVNATSIAITVSNPIQATIETSDGTPTSSTFCEGQSITLIASGGSVVAWDNGSAQSTRIISESGVYSVVVSDVNGCSASTDVNIQFASVGTQEIQVQETSGSTNNDARLCAGDSATLIATGGESYLWEDGSTNPQRIVSEGGTYSVQIITDQGCQTSGSIEIIVEQSTSTSISVNENSGNTNNDAILCAGDQASLTATGGNTYQWNNGNTTDQIIVTETGLYSVEITNQNGCSTYEEVYVEFNPIENYNIQITENSGLFENDGLLCLGEDAVLSIEGGVSYTWEDASIWSQRTVKSNGTYSVTLTNANGCTFEDSVEIIYTPSIEDDIAILSDDGNDTSNVLCQGETVNLVAPSGSAYEWNTGSQQNEIQVNTSGMYEVSVTDSHNCVSETSVQVQVSDAPSVTITIQEDSGIASNDGQLCFGDLASLTASGGVSYLWEDGSTNANRVISESGTYQVAITTIDGCLATASTVINIAAPIETAISVLNPSGLVLSNPICAGESVLLMIDESFEVEWIDGNTNNPRTVTASGVYTAEVLNQNGCYEFVDVIVDIEEEVSAQIAITENSGNFYNDGKLCAGDNATLTAQGGSQFLWSTGSQNNQIQVASPGIYTVTVTNQNGCTDVESTTIEMSSAIDGSIEITNAAGTVISDPVCSEENVYLSISTTFPIVWSDGNTENPRLVSTSGSYSAQITNSTGCTTELETNVQFAEEINADIVLSEDSGMSSNDGKLCQGDNALLVAEGGAYYLWEDGSTDAQRMVSNSGVYRVTVSNNQGCQSVAQVAVAVSVAPNVQIIVNEDSGLEDNDGVLCYGDSAVLVAQGGATYIWEDGSTSAQRTITEGGFYSVEAYSNEGCKSVGIINIDVQSELVPSITIEEYSGIINDGRLCYGQSATLKASGGDFYKWNTGSQEPTITVTQSGNYSVEISNAQGCVVTEAMTVVVDNEINATIQIEETSGEANNDGILCYGDDAVVTIAGGVSYVWNDGSTQNQRTIEESGIYTVEVYSENDCFVTEEVIIEFNQSSVTTIQIIETSGDFDNDGLLCNGDVATLLAIGGESFVWEDGFVGAQRVVTEPGTYRVVTTNESSCDDVAEVSISIAEKIDARIDVIESGNGLPSDGKLCAGEFASLVVSSNVDFTWEDGSNSVERTVTESGTYVITAIHPNGCREEVAVFLQFEEVYAARITSDEMIENDSVTLCYGQSITIEAIGGISVLWSDGSNEAARTITSSGIYSAIVSNEAGCTDEVSLEVVILDQVLASIDMDENSGTTINDGVICEGDKAMLSASGGSQYAWVNGGETKEIEVTEAGIYTVLVTDQNGCSAATSISVSTKSNVNADILVIDDSGFNMNDGVACDGDEIVLQAVGGSSYIWENGDVNLNRTVTEAGNYSVTITNEDGCKAEESREVWFNQNPEVTFDIVNQEGITVYDGLLLYGDSAHMTANGAANYVWNTGETEQNIVVEQEGLVSVEGTDRNGCTSEAFINMYFSIILSLNDMSIFVENDENTNTLTWTLPQDDNITNYQVERKINNGNFEPIENIASQMSQSDPIYTIADAGLLISGDYYYRINTIHTNGESSLSEIVHVIVDVNGQVATERMHVYPNPTSGLVNIDLPKYNDEECAVTLNVRNDFGAQVYQEVLAGDQYQDIQTYNINLASLTPGVYFLEVIRCNSRSIERIIITD